MAESTLSLGFAALKKLVGRYLGLTTDTTQWSTAAAEGVDDCIKSGLRQFYFPPPVNNERPHEWSFLRPVMEIETIAPYSTGTVAIANGATTMTLTDGVWPSWTATHGSLIVDTTEYEIASRTNDTVIELAEAWSEDTETAADYFLQHNGNYDLPDDYSGIDGDIVIESENYQPVITLVGEGNVRALRQHYPQLTDSGSTARPEVAAVRPKEHTDTTTGQRFEIMFYPLPNDVYTISYVMRILPDMLVDTTIEYPYGGAAHAETIRAACIAAAEEQENGNRLDGRSTYDKKKLFEQRLAASIAVDQAVLGIDYFGYNSDNSDAVHRPSPRARDRRRCRTGLITYDSGT